MNDDNRSSFGFEDLEVYKAAREFRQRIYKLVKLLPKEEKFGLCSQMARAAVSVTSNIAEGHGRYNWQDNTRFCRQARGSLCELVDQIGVCIDEEYTKVEHLNNLRADAATLIRLLNGYIAYLQKKQKDVS